MLLTTQYLDEADALADEISVIDHGRVIAHDTPDGLKRVVGGQRIGSGPTDPSRLDDVAQHPRRDRPAARREPSGRDQLYRPVAGEDALAATPSAGWPPTASRVTELSLHLPSLDEVFLTLTGRPATTDQHDDAEGGRGMTHHHRTRRTPAPAAVRRAAGARRAATGSALGYLRHVLALAKRSLIKTWRTPEALIDVTLQPVIFLLLFTYIFGGAIAGGSQQHYLQFLLPGMLAQTIAMAGVALGQNLNTDIEKGVFDRFRSLPIGRSAPLVGAVVADVVRYLILCVVTLGFGYADGLPGRDRPARGARRDRDLSIAFALCFCWISVFVGMMARTSGRGAGHHVPDRAAAVLRQQHLRPDRHDAGLAADLRQRQPDLPPGHHGPRA